MPYSDRHFGVDSGNAEFWLDVFLHRQRCDDSHIFFCVCLMLARCSRFVDTAFVLYAVPHSSKVELFLCMAAVASTKSHSWPKLTKDIIQIMIKIANKLQLLELFILKCMYKCQSTWIK